MLPHAWLYLFLLPSLLSYLSLSLFSVQSGQREFKQASGQLLNPGGSECSPSWEGPESSSRGFVYPRTLGGKTRLEDTVIAVAWNYTSFGLRIFLCDLYLYPGILYQECWNYVIFFFFFFLWLENRVSMVGRKRFRTIHSGANWNWEPSRHVRTWTTRTGDTHGGAWEPGWSVPSAGSLLPAPGQAQSEPDLSYAPSPANVQPIES